MKEWFNMKSSEVKQIEDKDLRKQYNYNWRYTWIHIINPLYDSLSNDKKREFHDFDSETKTIDEIVKKLKELSGGSEKTKEIIYAKVRR